MAMTVMAMTVTAKTATAKTVTAKTATEEGGQVIGQPSSCTILARDGQTALFMMTYFRIRATEIPAKDSPELFHVLIRLDRSGRI